MMNPVITLRLAARRLSKAPVFSLTVVTTLAFGIGAMTALFALVNGVLLKPLPYPEPDRLVALRHTASRTELAGTKLSRGTYLHYREHNRAFEEVALYRGGVFLNLTDRDGTPERIEVALVTPSLFSVLRTTPHLGRLFTVEDIEPGKKRPVLISYDLWRRRYGADPNMVGRTIEIARDRRVVAGVLPPGFHFPSPETQLWYAMTVEATAASLHLLESDGIARLRTGVSEEAADRDLERLVRMLPDAYPDITLGELQRMGLRAVMVPFKQTITGNVRTELVLILGAAGFVLLSAWANVANLALVRAERQRKEAAIQRALGATNRHLARWFFPEAALLAIVGGGLGLILTYAGATFHFGFGLDEIPRLRELSVDGRTLGLLAGLSILSAALLGIVPLIRAHTPAAAGALVAGIGRMTASRSEQAGRRLLVALQVALALTLLVGSALMARSLWQLQKAELGFRPENVLTFRVHLLARAYPLYSDVARFHDELLDRLRALPPVEMAEVTDILPLTEIPSDNSDYFVVNDGTRRSWDQLQPARWNFASSGYFRAIGIPLRRGRAFQTGDVERDPPSVILSGALADALFGDEDPIGHRVGWARGSMRKDNPAGYRVVGLVGDVPGETLRDGPSKAMYLPILYPLRDDSAGERMSHYDPRFASYVLRVNGSSAGIGSAVRRIVQEIDPKLVITDVSTMDQLVSESMARTRLIMLLLVVSASATILLSGVGLYGVLAYTVRQRTSELGVRLALGATPAGVVRMVVREGAALAMAGIALGLLSAFVLNRFLQSLLYEVSPVDAGAFVVAASVLFAMALVASYMPARRAGKIDPLRALNTQ